MADMDAADYAEEVIETGVVRKTVRTSYRIEEVSINGSDDGNDTVDKPTVDDQFIIFNYAFNEWH